jgi:hypothetical protein
VPIARDVQRIGIRLVELPTTAPTSMAASSTRALPSLDCARHVHGPSAQPRGLFNQRPTRLHHKNIAHLPTLGEAAAIRFPGQT